MRAIRMHDVGGPDVLQWEETEDPAPSDGEVLVSVEVAGVNYIDTYHRKGLYPVTLPFTPGVDGAGTVIALGKGVTDLTEGDRVAWFGPPGSYAERAVVLADRCALVPEGVSAEAAAASMTQGMTAHYLVHDTFPLAREDTCLVHAGAGGVGRLLIQMAKGIGATVFSTASTEEKRALAAEAGADVVFGYGDFVTGVREATGREHPLSVVYDGVGRTTFDGGLALLRPRGTFVLFGQASGPVAPLDPQILNAGGSLYLTRPSLGHYVADRAEFTRRAGDVFEAIRTGELDVLIGGKWPLAAAADAHRALESRATVGKLVLKSPQ